MVQRKKGIAMKLYSLILVIILFVIGIGGFVYTEFDQMNQKATYNLETTHTYSVLVEDIRRVQVDFKIQVQEWKNILIRGTNPKDYETYLNAFEALQHKVQNQFVGIKESLEKNRIDTSVIEVLIQEHQKLYESYHLALRNFDKGNPISYQIVDGVVRGQDRAATHKMDELVATIEEMAFSQYEMMQKEMILDTQLFYKKLAIVCLLSCVVIGIIMLVIRRTYKTLHEFIEQMSELIESAKNYDLSIRSQNITKDELGNILQKFNDFLEQVSYLIGETKATGKQVASTSKGMLDGTNYISNSSQEMLKVITDIAEGAEKQSDEAKKSYQAVQEVVKGVERITYSTKAMNELVDHSVKAVKDGNKYLQLQNEKMITTKKNSENVRGVVAELAVKSREIESVIQFIHTITDQINLLSLNASIEAARAGEAGRGFTVVANEIKNLATLSKESTQKIGTLITGIQQHIEQAVVEVDESKGAIDDQMQSLQFINSALRNIDESVVKVVKEVEEVYGETRGIHIQVQEVEKIIDHINYIAEESEQATNEIAASVQEQTTSIMEMANAMYQLAGSSEQLEKMVERFKV